jgi:LasA protease
MKNNMYPSLQLKLSISLLLSVFMITSCGPLWGSATMLATIEYSSTSTTSSASQSIPYLTSTTNNLFGTTSTPTLDPTQELILSSTPTTNIPTISIPNLIYYSQPGDSLIAVAKHFGVDTSEIKSDGDLPQADLINPGTFMMIPDRIDSETSPAIQIMPDSEVIYSPSAIDFDVLNYVSAAGGYINQYKEYLESTKITYGGDIVKKQALENSINPRLLLALLEYKSGWVSGKPKNLADTDYPLGYVDLRYVGLFRQYMLVAGDISLGYYGWRSGTLTELTFTDGKSIRIAPDLNAGTVAIYYYFSQKNNYSDWMAIIDPNEGFMKLYKSMFGDPWARAQKVEPLFPPGLTQPQLSLPFYPADTWSFLWGPHSAWEIEGGALAALDFGPGVEHTTPCYDSVSWVLASTAGQVVRSGNGIVVLDLDNDGYEQTGWDLMYLHIATKDRVPLGTWLNKDDRVGHPSCEGGRANGTHIHFARKFNGEWILADGSLPFDLSGWIAHAGKTLGEGTLTKGDQVVIASPISPAVSKIVRQPGE